MEAKISDFFWPSLQPYAVLEILLERTKPTAKIVGAPAPLGFALPGYSMTGRACCCGTMQFQAGNPFDATGSLAIDPVCLHINKV